MCEISEDEVVPEIVYMGTRSLSESAPWPSGVGVLLKTEHMKVRRGKKGVAKGGEK